MNNSKIHKALAAKLETVAAGLNLEVAWFNVKYTPPATGIYLEEHMLPAENEDAFLQGTKAIRRGVYQVTLVYPLIKGSQKAEELADAVAEAFPNNSLVDPEQPGLFVNGFADVFTGLVDETAYRIPVSIPYMVLA